MSCPRPAHEIAAYLDGELDLEGTLAFERHLEECPDCARALAAQRSLSEAIGRAGLRLAPSPEQTRRLHRAVRDAARPAAPPRWPAWRLPAIAALLLVALASWTLGRFGPPQPAPDLAEEVVASHVRSLLVGHPADVVSTDRHTVKPWFAGKLDYSPAVLDLASQGFPLAGGRLDYLGHHPVAALVYRADRHLINLFTWPAAFTADRSGAALITVERQGFHAVHWSQSGMTYWAVSDASPERLQRFAHLLQSAIARP
jgi:anti-sigma factor RsiW